jgi:DNA-binding XRE family transcriptional regulator
VNIVILGQIGKASSIFNPAGSGNTFDGISLGRHNCIMATKWRDIRRQHSLEVEAKIAHEVKDAATVMTLYQLREARSLTQVNLAKVLEINQGAVSRMEKRTDMYVSTLRSYIQAMGGQLQVKAIFAEGEVEIDQFEKLSEPAENHQASASE